MCIHSSQKADSLVLENNLEDEDENESIRDFDDDNNNKAQNNSRTVDKSSKNTFRRSKIVKRRHSKVQKNNIGNQIKNLSLDINRLVKIDDKDVSYTTNELLLKAKSRNITLERDNELGFGFIAGSEKPMVIRFVSPSNFYLFTNVTNPFLKFKFFN